MKFLSFEELYSDAEFRARLFLAYYEDFEQITLNSKFLWNYIEHQSGGMVCHQRKLIATELDVDILGYEKIIRLMQITDNIEKGHRCIGIGGTKKEEIKELDDYLKKESLDSDNSITLFEEGIIPIKATIKNYKEFNKNFDNKFEVLFNNEKYKKAIFILYENCD
jgi:hypothetical protein